MKKFLLCLLTGMAALGASAYEVDFNSPISTSDLDFKVAPGWKHLVDRGSYSSDIVHYTYKSTGGVDNSGCLLVGEQAYYDYWDDYDDIPLYDLLVTPLVSGNVSIEVKKDSSWGGSITFYKVAMVNGKLTRMEEIPVQDPGLTTLDYTLVELPAIEEPTMIGIRGNEVYLDNFYAENAEVSLDPSLSISTLSAGQSSGKVYCDADNNFTLSATVKVKNNGDVDLFAGEEGYCVRIVLMKKDEAGNYVVDRVITEQPITQDLAIGEVSNEIQISASIPEDSIEPEDGSEEKSRRFDVQEGITGSTKILGNYTPVPYKPIPVFKDANGNTINTDSTFDLGLVQGGTTYKLSIGNAGAAPLEVSSMTIGGDLFTVPGLDSFTLATSASMDIELLFSSEVVGEQTGSITFNCENTEDFVLNLKGNLLDASLWYVNFEDGEMPANMIAQGTWQTSNSLAYGDFDYYAVNNFTGEGEMLISPLLMVGEGETLRFDAARNYGGTSFLNIYYSDDRENWTLIRSLSAETENEEDWLTDECSGYAWGTATKYLFTPFTVSVPAGNHYIAFEAGNARVTNILGFKPAEVAIDLYFTNVNMPAVAMVNNEFIAKATVKNLTANTVEAGSYTVALMSGDQILAEGEALEIPGLSSVDYEFSFIPNEISLQELYVRLIAGDYVCESPATEVSFTEELLAREVQVGEVNETDNKNCPPLALYYYKSQSETIYKADQLGIAAGTKITRITFCGRSSYDKTVNSQLTVRFQNTSDEAPTEILLNEEALNEMTTVYDDAYTFQVSAANDPVLSITLAEPFEYTGENLRVVFNSVQPSEFATVYFELDSNIKDQSIVRYADGSLPDSFSPCSMPVMYMEVSMDAPTLSGVITDSDNNTVADAVIKLQSGDVVYTAVSDENGEYEVQVIQYEREYTLTVTAAGFEPYTETVVFDSPEDKVLNICIGEPTGVNALKSEEGEEVIFDLNGVRLQQKPEKGMVIINGQTRVIR